jgi:hypothetical protein
MFCAKTLLKKRLSGEVCREKGDFVKETVLLARKSMLVKRS